MSNEIATAAACVSAIASCCSAFLFLKSLSIADRSLERAGVTPVFVKIIDIINECNKRYENLKDIRYPLNKDGIDKQAQSELYFRKYWSLQSDQLDYYLMGVIDLITYGFWIEKMIDLFKHDNVFEGCGAVDGWERYGLRSFQQNRPFFHLVTQIMRYADAGRDSEGTEVSSEQFAIRLVTSLYDNEQIAAYRVAVRNAASESAKIDWKAISADMPTAFKQIAYDNPKAFSDSADHEKDVILAPALIKILQEKFTIKPKILDFGCGPFMIGSKLQKEGYDTDGFDIDKKMINAAGNNNNGGHLFFEISTVPSSYGVVLMSFVHQIASNEQILKNQFLRPAISKLMEGGALLIVGAHPDWMGTPHSSMLCQPNQRREFSEVDATIFSSDGKNIFKPIGDHFISIQALKSYLSQLGFLKFEQIDIPDVESAYRPASTADKPAYFALIAGR